MKFILASKRLPEEDGWYFIKTRNPIRKKGSFFSVANQAWERSNDHIYEWLDETPQPKEVFTWPTDEEIFRAAPYSGVNDLTGNSYGDEGHDAFIEGVKWLKEYLSNQSKLK